MKRRAKGLRLVLEIDPGLAAWLKALVKGIGIHGTVKETAIFMIREGVIERSKNDNFFAGMYPHLPKHIQDACRHRVDFEK